KEEVPVKVTVKDPSSAPTDADKNEPTGKPQTVNKGTTPKAEDSIGNVKDLPKGTKVAFKDPVDTATPGEKDATVVVTYPDGSKEEVPVKVTVKDPSSAPTDADKNEPTGKPQTVNKGTTPKAEDLIGNVKDLPKGTKVAFKDPVDTATPGEKDATVVVTYPDGSTEEVPVKVTVKDPSSAPTDADKNEPTAKPQTVNKGTTPKAEDSIGNVKDLPKGTTVAYKEPVDTTTPGEKDATVVVTYPDGSKEEVPVKVTVKEPSSTPTDADKNEPTPKAQTVDKGTEPKAEDSIGNLKDLPKGTTVAFKDPVDTTTPGEKPATVVVTYPDGSKEEVPVKVTVTDPSSKPTDADKNEPTPKAQTVDKGTEPKAEDSIGNLKDLPKGTTVAFKDPVDTTTPGEKPATVVVTYPDGSKEEVPVKVTVTDPSSPEDPTTKDTDGDGLTDKEEADKGTDPKKADTDGDGLTDKEEADKGTDPKKADTDGDGLTDKEEADKGTDPKKADTDGDGFTDKEEVAKGTDPKDPNSKPEDPATPDTKAPAKPEIKTDLTDKAGTKTPVEVTAEPGSKVELFDKDGNKLGEGVADENGKATITPTKELPAGDVTAKATDPAGNVSEPSTPEKATADTKAPAKPEIKTDLTDKAGTKTPVEVTAEPGSKVELFDKDGNKLGEGVADENGKATITPTKELPAGDVTAKATDPAGNVSEPSTPEKATADTKAPAKPEIKTDLTDKAGTKTPVEVTAEPGSKVELFDKDGNKLGEGVADENGKATITPTKELPAGDVTAKATDPAGNVSEPSTPEKATADTKAPAKPEIKTDLTDKAGTKTPVEVTAEPGSKVELFDKDG
ncbi:YSIRK signal domain/LPXTG anchor domain surface protein, partial [Streptococcus mitis]|nr:YSIRK signal domain/LPXTG anchor domain surface protein [Streptococcus mitis]